MAKEKVLSEVLNLRIDEAMSQEVKRIAGLEGEAESETARKLIEWGIEAHRAREIALLELPYSVKWPSGPRGEAMALRVSAKWVQLDYDPDEPPGYYDEP